MVGYKVKYRTILSDGEVRHVIEYGEPELDANGVVIRTFGTIQDITDRKRIELDLHVAEL